jgi:hypothetical protein
MHSGANLQQLLSAEGHRIKQSKGEGLVAFEDAGTCKEKKRYSKRAEETVIL